MKAKTLAEYDKLKALILLRKKELGMTNQDIAEDVGITRQTFARMMCDRSTDDWAFGAIIAVCQALDVSPAAFYDAIEYERRVT